jgi:hypothetical protein
MRAVLLASALLFATSPAFAQGFDLGLGTGDSTATVTTQQVMPSFDGPFIPATVVSGVNVRSAPTTHGSSVVATLHEGDQVSVRCALGWCELSGNGGYAAQKFLSLSDGGFGAMGTDAQLDDSGQFNADGGFAAGSLDTTGNFDTANAQDLGGSGSFDAMSPPADGAVSTGDAPPVKSLTQLGTTASVPANFDGLWTMVDPSGKPGMPLILKQQNTSVTGTLQNPGRLAKLTGDIAGTKLSFTYDMLDGKGKTIASGNGFMNLGKDGASLNGVLMLNGLVVSNIVATR